MTAVAEPVELTEITEPGVYDLPAEVYHRDIVVGGSLSASGTKLLLPPSCPAKFQWNRKHGQGSKKTFDFGAAAHREVLGAGSDVVVIAGTGKDENAWRTNDDKAAVEAVRAEGKTPITPRDADTVADMAAALREHPVAAALLSPDYIDAEQVLVWLDDDAGIWCRAMLDGLPRRTAIRVGERFIIVDYKSTKSADPRSLAKSFAEYGYHRQDAWYVDGVRALGLDEDPTFVFVCQEKDPPYLVAAVQLNDEARSIGARENRLARHLFRRCMETDTWPGYGDAVLSLGLPAWMVAQHEIAQNLGHYDIDFEEYS